MLAVKGIADLVGDRVDVPLVGGGSTLHRNFDFAASSPALVAAHEAVEEFLPWYSSVHRGAGYKSQVATRAYEAARGDVAAFVGARDDDTVVFTRNTTDALNLLSVAAPAGTRVLVFDAEHHANLLPWRRHQVIPLETPGSPDEVAGVLEEALHRARAAGPGPLLVAVTAASNVTGELWPVADVVGVAHEHGAKVVVDAAQLAPHAPVDLAAWGADWIAFSGHKLYAPYGAGALVGRRHWLGDAEPFLRGGGAVLFVTVDSVEWGDLPGRQEAGSPNVVGAVAMAAACRELRRIGMDVVVAHEAALEAHARTRLAGVPGLTRYRLWGDEHPSIGVVAFNLDGLRHNLVAAALSAEHGIAVRHGCFCAHPLLLRLLQVPMEKAEHLRAALATGCHVDMPGAVRASVGLSTTSADIDGLADALSELAAEGPRWQYRVDETSGDFVPDPDDRPLPDCSFLSASASV